MTSLVSASQVVTGQVQSLDSLRAHALPSDAMIFASATKVQPANQNPGSYGLVESANALTLSTTGSVPVVTQSPFADLYKEGSLYFNGTVGNYVSGTATGLMGTQWNTTGLTVEAWVNYPTFTGAGLASGATSLPYLVGQIQPAGGSIYWALGANTLGYVTFYYNASGNQNITSSIQIATNTWNHIAFSCLPGGATANIYVNGTSVASTSISGTPLVNSTFPLTLGQYNSNSPNLNAYVADVRITTGAALYTGSSFTVPSAPLSPAATGVAQALIRAGANAPYVSNGALTFDRGLKQFMNFGPMTFNIATRGFSIVFRYTWNGVVTGYEQIFRAYISSSSYLQVSRYGGFGQLYVSYFNPSQTVLAYSATGLNQGTNYVATFVYNPSVGSGTGQWWINGAPSGSPITGLASTLAADFSTIASYVSNDGTGGSHTNASMNTFAVYNRALSNVEILNAYSALTTSTTNAPIEIGDANGVTAFAVTSDGRVNVTKMGQTSNVVPWPPAAMTGYVTSINGGTYVASASTEFSPAGSGYPYAWYAFDRNTSNYWVSVGAGYNTSSPYNYTGSVTTTDVNGTVYPGEWLQVQLPSPITLSSYTAVFNSWTSAAPSTWVVLGSRDGVNWFLVDSRAGQTYSSATQSFTLSTAPTQAFSYFRLVTRNVTGTGGYVQVYELYYYGTADTAQTLTVAQPVTLSYGAQTSSLVGIANNASYVPQDFSSSGLNIPAYVVSNTATVANTVAFSSFGPFAGEGSLYFPGGTGAYVNFGQPAQLAYNWTSYDFTIEMFVFSLFTPSTDQRLFARDYEQLIYITTNNTLRVYMAGVTGPTSGAFIGGAVPQNQWSHVAVSWSQSAQTMYISVNGSVTAVALTAGTPTYAGTRNAVMGTWAGANGLLNTSISNLRFTRGLALYTTTFTPPTAPLQPIQGVTQAGTPYGTVLLLRNAPAPGRVLTSKFGGANSGGVNGAPLTLPFPPAAMTGYSTALSSGYGQGTYVASASSEVNTLFLAWYAFDQILGNWWTSAIQYNGSAPYNYTGSVTTVDINGNSYAGEWIQIQMPSAIVPVSYTIGQSNGGVNQQYSPTKFWILGSRDGSNWSLVDSRTGAVSPWAVASPTFTVTASQAFTHFRIVSNILLGNGTAVSLSQINFNGTIEGPNVTADGRLGLGVTNPTQALEVAGSAVVAGTLSAGNPLMFRNALYNGGMAVNQRGISTNWASPTAIGTSGTGLNYGLDRMNMVRSSFASGGATAQGTLATTDAPFSQGLQYYMRLGRSSGNATADAVYFNQALETRESYKFAGQTATLSAYYRTGSGFSGTGLTLNFNYGTGTDQNAVTGFTGAVTLTSPSLSASNAWQRATFSAFIPQTATQLSIYMIYTPSGTAGGFDYFDVTGVQLEKGSVATPFEVRPYATELALCQRYYFRTADAASSTAVMVGGVETATLAAVAMVLPVTMRIAPTGALGSGIRFFSSATGGIAVSINAQRSTATNAGLYVATAGGCTAGQVCYLYNFTTSSYIEFNSEL